MFTKERLLNAIFITFGVMLALGVGVYRQLSGGTFEIRWSEVTLLVLPVLLWSLASGQFESFRLSSTGLQIKTAFQRAASKQVVLDDKIVRLAMPKMSRKESSSKLYIVKRKHPETLDLQLRQDEGYDQGALMEYIYDLTDTAGFKYFLFFDKAPSKPFLGGIGAPDLCRSLAESNTNSGLPATQDQPTMSVSMLTEILNCKRDFEPIRRLRGFVDRDQALRKSADKRTALTRMEELGTTWLPVVDRGKLVGVVDRSELSAGLLMDVVKALEARATG
jgi:hypothetical protein